MIQLLPNPLKVFTALGLALIVGSSIASADITIESFDQPDFDPGLQFSFVDSNNTITANPTSWKIDLTTSTQSDYYGYARSIVASGGFFDISSETSLEFDFELHEAGVFGTEVFVVLEDFFGGVSVYKSAFGVGSHLYTATLASPTSTDGTGPADLTDIAAIQIQANSFGQAPGGGGGAVSAPYSITFNELTATSPTPPDSSVITDFNDVGVFTPGYESWSSASITTGPDSLNVVSSGFGGAVGQVFGTLEAAGSTHVELDITINSTDEPVNITALVEDADGTQNVWQWYGIGTDNGINGTDNHKLSFRMETVTDENLIGNAHSWQTVANDLTPEDLEDNDVLDLDNLKFFHIQVEPESLDTNSNYDVSFNNFSVKKIDGGFDTDNDADGNDFLTWQRGLTPGGGGSADLLEWQTNYGNVVSGGAGNSALQAIPEPTSICLLLLSSMLLGVRRFKSQNR